MIDSVTVHVVVATIVDMGVSVTIAPCEGPCVCGLSEEDSGTDSCDAELHNGVRLVWYCQSLHQERQREKRTMGVYVAVQARKARGGLQRVGGPLQNPPLHDIRNESE